MNIQKLIKLNKRLEEAFEKLQDYGEVLFEVHDGKITKKRIQELMDYVIGITSEVGGEKVDEWANPDDGYGYWVDKLAIISCELDEELKAYSGNHKVTENIRVVRFRGQPLLQPPATNEETVQITMALPKKLVKSILKKYGFEIFQEDLFDFCEREGWE